MMKDYFRLFPVLISSLLLSIGVFGCVSMLSDSIIIDLDKAPNNKISITRIYERIEIVPLDNLGRGNLSQLSELSVTRDKFYFKCGDSMIVSYSQDGRLIDSLSFGSLVTDYYIFNDSILNLLAEKEFISYFLPDNSLMKRTFLETPIALTKIAREDENVVLFSGYNGSNDYSCKYYLDKNVFSEAQGQINYSNITKIAEGIHYFNYCDHLYKLYPHSGCIWECGDFHHQFLNPIFKKKNSGGIEFRSAQITDNKIYYSLLINDKECLLILNRAERAYSMLLNGEEREFTVHGANKKYLLINKSREGVHLPLGVIRDGINYFYCSSSDLYRYLTRDLLDSQNAEMMDVAVKKKNNVVIKYFL